MFKKILMHTTCVELSIGELTSLMSNITPSAGLRTRLSPSGTTRTGSRKKYMHNNDITKQIIPKLQEIANPMQDIRNDIIINIYPSLWML
ncbi:hypothetical protein EHF_0681 [Ehrlichia japonica]|uniref:Uncharacterized protein n=1 Tax=Ehrlichia japonica TaxID=391036 RepID=X5GCG7_9RICK|nr:hypothetical protein EHF_0681 [Ehrlichia japonica]